MEPQDANNHKLFQRHRRPPPGQCLPSQVFDIMTISLLCALCGGETAVDMADFGVAKEDFLELPHGPPCHDTFSRQFRLIDPQSFQRFLTGSAPILYTH